MQVERMPLKKLKVSDRNARVHSEVQVDQLAASIETFGWTIPLLIDENGIVIAGHGRLLAARKMGLKEAPCLIARDWSETQKRAYRLADNRLAENSQWDRDLLRDELSFLDGVAFDLSVPGFSDEELSSMVAGFEPNLNPTFGARNVTQADIDAQQEKLRQAQRNADAARHDALDDVICPSCGHEFAVSLPS